MSESRVVEKILRPLTNNFENVVCVTEESKNLVEMIVDELSSSLEAHEQRKKKRARGVRRSTSSQDNTKRRQVGQ
jgi:hypothetical protein